jgi:hypothetical protein
VLQRIEHLVMIPVAGVNQVTLRTPAYARSITENAVADIILTAKGDVL